MAMRLAAILALALAVSGWTGLPASAAQATRPWVACSKAGGDRAARSAGLDHALNTDPVLRRAFNPKRFNPAYRRPSRVYRTPSTSLCGDYDGDGRTDRAVLYQCCTVSAPAAWLLLRRTGSAWRIVYKRLHDTTFTLAGDGTQLVSTEPRYSPSDALCCPTRLRIGTLRWTGRSFERTLRIEDAPHP
jgi:hypothetical protein